MAIPTSKPANDNRFDSKLLQTLTAAKNGDLSARPRIEWTGLWSSKVGKGTQFKVYLPAIAMTEPQPQETRPQKLPRGHGELILVVDDEEIVRDVTQKTLEEFGYSVLMANDGTEAIVSYAEHRQEIQVVLTDMMMPHLNGESVIRALKKMNPEAKLVAASGFRSGPVTPNDSLGVQAFLHKPFTAATLLNVLHDVIEGEEVHYSPKPSHQGSDRAEFEAEAMTGATAL